MKITDLNTFDTVKQKGLTKFLPDKPRIAVGMGTCGIGNGAKEIYETFKELIDKRNSDIYLTKTGCFGFCAQEPLVNVHIPGNPLIILHKVTAKDSEQIIKSVTAGKIPQKNVLCKIEQWDHLTSIITYGKKFPEIPNWFEIPFFSSQKKIVLRNCGLINPEDIEEYIAVGGYQGLYKVLNKLSPDEIIEELKKSRLRGRGGAGFPTGKKWELMKIVQSNEKYIICNADEGDPGAYMNRNEIESDPHMLLEGMIIGGYTMGAKAGIIYVRAEYPLAIERLKNALEQAKQYGLLGENILNSGFNFDIHIVEGAGAFVCGEETALIASIEGKPGRPRPRPPFPAQKGLWDKPTTINNVETWCNVPVIIIKGGQWFTETGTQNSAGTKVFSLVGKIKNTGLVELPLGASLQTIVYNIGEGTGNRKKVKAVQTGGPSGGCIPAQLFDTPVDYESLTSLGAIMGSGGIVVMDEDNCMVDVAKYFTEFTTSESCGKCVSCREGLYQELNILKSVSEGKSSLNDLPQLETLGKVIKDTALCGLGQTGPNPVLTTLKYFRNEYEEHIIEQRCYAGICEILFLSPCENSCPLHMNIPGFLQLFKENRVEEAFELVLQDNPLPATTGRICHHPCELRCRRADIDAPVSPGEVHRYIADSIYKQKKDRTVLKKLIEEKLPHTGKKIAVIGSGPAGLTAAFYLSRLGHKVTVYESHSKPGGMLRITIPEFRFPKSVLDKEIELIKQLGVKFVFNTKIGVNKSLPELEREYDKIFLSIGAHKEISLGIRGENLSGVLSGVEFLELVASNKKPRIGKKVVVIGGGNVAIDAARTSVRLGSEVTIVYRREREDMPANQEEIEEAEHEGIKIMFLLAPKQITGDEKGKVKQIEVEQMIPGDFDSSGRRKPEPTGKMGSIPCDTVILAIGEKVDSGFIKEAGIKVRNNGTVEVNKFTYQTNNPQIYAGGDIITGPNTVTEAMRAGKKVAEIIDTQLMSENRFSKLFKKFVYKNQVPLKPEGGEKPYVDKLSLKSIKNNFKEISLGLSENKTWVECIRCLRCDVKIN